MEWQSQKQISKSKQIQAQAYLYGIMGNIFSALEWYAKRSSNKNQLKIHFEHYNNFNYGKMKSLEDLRNQIIVQLEIFKVSYKLYVKEYGAYEFPPSLSKEQIIQYIKKWEECISKNDIPLYETAINIIEDRKVDSFLSELKGDGKYIVLREYEKNGDYKVDMEIDKEEVGEKNLQKVGIDREERLKKETDLNNKSEDKVRLIEKSMGEEGIKVVKCYMTNEPNRIVHINQNDKRILHKIARSNEELKKMLNEYEKIGVYYYNDNKTDLDKLCAHCEELSSQCAEKKLKVLVYYIDSFVKLLQSTKEDNQQ